MSKTTNILIVGVGGQGTILASRVLAGVLLAEGYDVKVSEIHGMSQRGGSVVTQVRYGDFVASPIIEPQTANIVLAFELLEALRSLPFLAEGGKLIVNTQAILPMPVVTGEAQYPTDALSQLEKQASHVLAIDALRMALACGNPKGVNIVLLGILSALMDIKEETWLLVLRDKVPQRFLGVNLAAFAEGRKWGLNKK